MFKGDYIDLNYVFTVSEGDNSFVREMIQSFLSDTPDLLNKMKNLSDLKEWKKVGDLAHKFKSSLMFMGINSLHDIIRKVEFSGRNNIQIETIPVMVAEIHTTCLKAIEELQSYLNTSS